MTAYDYDVVVVGAGPAGLAAAIRLRWVKGFQPLPMSVALVDPEPPGGLGAIGGCVLTGPSWAMNADGLLPRLLADADALAIPRISERAVGVDRLAAGHLAVVLASGRRVSCHAVILATGFRALHGEAPRFGRGLHLTYKGYAYFPELIHAAARDAGGQGLVVIGRADTLDLLPLLEPWVSLAGSITLALQPPLPAQRPARPGIHIIPCVTSSYLGRGALTGVRARIVDGAEVDLPCGAVLVDYHSFERCPEPWGGETLPRRADGFIQVDAHMATPTPGVFAAGDVTGRYASTAMALGDGICAGFSAYAYTYRRKLGRDPSLFAYAATGDPPSTWADASRRERPFPLPDAALIVPLVPRDEGPGDTPLDEVLAGEEAPTVAALRARVGDAAEADRILFKEMHRRALTLHHTAQTFVKQG